MIHYPRVHIEFCTKCRWNLRAAWYVQELLSTFGPQLGEVAMAPADSGVFRVWIKVDTNSEDKLLWDRKTQGFPDSKDLKQLVRDIIDPTRHLGHSERKDSESRGAGSGVASSGVASSGAASSVAASSGVDSSGAASSGAASSGVANSGAASSGAANSGAASSGVANSGVASSGVASSGVANSDIASAGIASAGGLDQVCIDCER